MNLITGLTIASQNQTITFDGSNYILEEVTGLETPTTRLVRYNLPGASGAYISNALYGERALKIKGWVNASDASRLTYMTNRINLINTLAYQRDDNNNLVNQTLTFTLENGLILTTTGYVDTGLQMGFSPDQTDFEEFQITFVCPDPNLYSLTQSSYSVSLPVGGGVAIPTAIPISLAPSSGGTVVVTNQGSGTVFPTITLTAPLTRPYITNRRTGGFLSLNVTTNVGDANIVIDCANQKITQGTNDITGVQSQDSSFWDILGGNNTIAFSAAAGSGSGTIQFYAAYLGI